MRKRLFAIYNILIEFFFLVFRIIQVGMFKCHLCPKEMLHHMEAIRPHVMKAHKTTSFKAYGKRLEKGEKQSSNRGSVVAAGAAAADATDVTNHDGDSTSQKTKRGKVGKSWYHGSTFQCLVCEELFNALSAVSIHLNKKHGKPARIGHSYSAEYARMDCGVCSKNIVHSYEAIRGHLKTHKMTTAYYEYRFIT